MASQTLNTTCFNHVPLDRKKVGLTARYIHYMIQMYIAVLKNTFNFEFRLNGKSQINKGDITTNAF